MRPTIVLIASSALAIAVVDFALSTFPLLREQSRLREQIADRQESDLARLATRGLGVPPTAETLRTIQKAADRARADFETGRGHWLAEAHSAVDYLIERDARPLVESQQALRDRVGGLLLSLRPELEGRTGLPIAPLGIEFPTTTTEVSSDPAVLRDQAERGVLLRWFLECLPEGPAVDVILLSFDRRKGEPLEVELELVAESPEALSFFHHFLEQSLDVAPRRLLSYSLAPVGTEHWGPGLSRFATPPVRLSMQCSLESPS